MPDEFKKPNDFDPAKFVNNWDQLPDEEKKDYLDQVHKIQKMKDHDQYVEETIRKQYDPDSPNAKPDPFFDKEIKQPEKEMNDKIEKMNQANQPLTEKGQASVMGYPDNAAQESGETNKSDAQKILDQQKFEDRDSHLVNGKHYKSAEKSILEQELKKFDVDDPNNPGYKNDPQWQKYLKEEQEDLDRIKKISEDLENNTAE